MKHRIIITVMAFAVVVSGLPAHAKGPPDRPVLLKDANGIEIGRVIGMETVSRPYVLTGKGYRTALNLGSRVTAARVRTTGEVAYENIDCPKDEVAYIAGSNVGSVFSPTSDIDNAYAEGRLMYSPPAAQFVEGVIIRSVFGDEGCINFEESPVSVDGYPAYHNDPDITGIQNTSYPGRLVLE